MSAASSADPLELRLLYSPQSPEPPQHAFLLLDELGVLEAFYGGAGGGGKSSALLMAALRYVDVPGYAALLLRRTYPELALPGAIMDRSKSWLAGTDARWSETDFRWTFDSGASLSFGHLQSANDVYRYASAEFQFIGFDELTTFRQGDYRFLFTRLRRPSPPDPDEPMPIDPVQRELRQRQRLHAQALAQVPLRMRSAGNPGGPGHAWVKARLIDKEVDENDPQDTRERANRRIFIPAKLNDNPHVDETSYVESLNHVDPVLRARILDGDWDAVDADTVYPSSWVGAVKSYGEELDRDLEAGTMPPPAGDALAIGMDWGEHSHALIGWPLARGGLYVVGEAVGESLEPGAFAEAVIDALLGVVDLGRRPRPAGWKHPAGEVLTARRRGQPLPGALPPAPAHRRGDELALPRAALALVSDHRYDSAGVQPMRTYVARVRNLTHRARVTAIPFGAPAPRTGNTAGARSFKAETIGHLRRLAEHTYAVRRYPTIEAYVRTELERPDWTARRFEAEVKRVAGAGPLAIGRRCPQLRRQIGALEWADREAGRIAKGDDHGPDALIALDAPNAVRHRR